jgi:hypothetical protein
MDRSLLFFAGALFANGIPHFVNGISGREFARPFVYRFMPFIPNPLFNSLWGMLSLGLSALALGWYGRLHADFRLLAGPGREQAIAAAGFIMAAIGLPLFFMRGGWSAK